MKNLRATVMLVLSLVIAVVATVIAAAWVQQKGDAATNQVVVAAVDIELGSRLTPVMTKAVPWPSGNVPPGVFSKPEDLSDRVVKTSVLRGEAILDSKLAPIGTQGGLSAVIKEGNRAMTVRVNDVIGVAGFALPGNYVDVVVSTQQDDNKSKQISKIVLEHILVLAVAQEASRDETKPKVVSAVTLEVTPAQAERLDLARSVGTLSLVLRNQIDSKPSETAGITKQQLLGDGPQPQVVKVAATAAAAAPRKPRPARTTPTAVTNRVCVEVIKGGRKTTECF